MPLASLADWILGFSVHLLTEWNLFVSVYLRCEHRSAKRGKTWPTCWLPVEAQLAVISVSLQLKSLFSLLSFIYNLLTWAWKGPSSSWRHLLRARNILHVRLEVHLESWAAWLDFSASAAHIPHQCRLISAFSALSLLSLSAWVPRSILKCSQLSSARPSLHIS